MKDYKSQIALLRCELREARQRGDVAEVDRIAEALARLLDEYFFARGGLVFPPYFSRLRVRC